MEDEIKIPVKVHWLTCSIKKITVYDYTGARDGTSASQQRIVERYLDKPPVKYEPLAYTVGGEDGVRAYWIEGDFIYEADGDDGHWWLVSKMHKDWLKELAACITALNSIEDLP